MINQKSDETEENEYFDDLILIQKIIEPNLNNGYNRLELTYETKEDNEKINLIGGFFYFFAKKYLMICDPEKKRLISDYVYTFDSKGEHQIIIIVSELFKNFNGMFHRCYNLKSIKGHLDTSHVADFGCMFMECNNLTNIDFVKDWDVSAGENFNSMFSQCFNLTNIDTLKNWNVSKGTNFSYMFYACKNLTEVDSLKNWNISKGTNFEGMFKNCDKLNMDKIPPNLKVLIN